MDQILFCKKSAELLGNSEAKAELEMLCERQTYFLTFWGGFSSGKSRLINRLLGRELLPVGETETTPLVMFIRYTDGPEEARLMMGNEQVLLPIAQVREIYQGNTEYCGWIERAEYLEIRVHHDLLRSGMVLVDMPGSNTLLQRHQDLAERMLARSSRLIYVMSKTPTQVDQIWVRRIREGGISMTFVRTHCDEIRQSEETTQEAREQMLETLREVMGEEPQLILLSSLSPAGEWEQGVQELRNVIEALGSDLQAASQQADQERLDALTHRLAAQLEEFRQHFGEGHSEEDLTAREEECQRQVETLSAVRKQQRTRAIEYVRSIKKELTAALRDCDDTRYERMEQRVDTLTIQDCEQRQQIESFCMKEMQNGLEAIQGVYEAQLAPFLENVRRELGVDVSTVLGPCPSFPQMVDEQDQQILAINERLLDLKKLIEQCDKDGVREAVFDDPDQLQALAAQVGLLQKELKQVNSEYQPRYYWEEPQGIQPSQILRAVGEVVDVALLFYDPEIMMFKGGQSALQAVPQSVPNAVPSMEQFLASLDSTKDTAYLAAQVTNSMANAVGKAAQVKESRLPALFDQVNNVRSRATQSGLTSALNMTTVAFWAEQLGRLFDEKPQKRIDLAYEQQYYQRKSEIEQQVEQIYLKKNEKMLEIQRAKTKEEQRLKQVQEMKERALKVERQLREEEAQIRQNAKTQWLNQWKTSLKTMLREGYDQLKNEMARRYTDALEPRLLAYLDDQSRAAQDLLKQQKQHYAKLAQMRDDCLRPLQQCEELLAQAEDWL